MTPQEAKGRLSALLEDFTHRFEEINKDEKIVASSAVFFTDDKDFNKKLEECPDAKEATLFAEIRFGTPEDVKAEEAFGCFFDTAVSSGNISEEKFEAGVEDLRADIEAFLSDFAESDDKGAFIENRDERAKEELAALEKKIAGDKKIMIISSIVAVAVAAVMLILEFILTK